MENGEVPRYVILEHEGLRDRHWDFMLESGPALRTWALGGAPQAGERLAAEALGDHRIEYLDYQGQVSGGRGTVARWDQGTYELLAESESELQVRLSGQRLEGVATLRRCAAERWEFVLAENPG